MSAFLAQAETLSRRAHEGQERKGGGPYVEHPRRVAELLEAAGFDDLTIAAGWLHDTLEDTEAGESDLVALHPDLPAIIRSVTEDASLPWTGRKRAFTDALRGASDKAKAVACADRIDNLTEFLADYDRVGPSLWDRWPERAPSDKLAADRYFLEMLQSSWRHPLVDRLSKLVEQEATAVP